MGKSTESKSSGFWVLLFLISIGLLFFFPIGTILGVLFLIYSLHLATKRQGIWVCKKCGHTAERKMKWNEMS